jgi:hypothetical protein
VTTFPLRLPKDLKERASEQAEAVGLSLNQYIATALAVHVGAQAEAERYFEVRGNRATPGRLKQVLAKAKSRKRPRPGDELG